MDRLVKIIAGGVVLSLILMYFVNQSKAQDAAAWDALAVARLAGNNIEALETALDQTRGSDAEPYARLQLASACLAEGGPENTQRARQVADEGLQALPDHPTATWLEKISSAAASFDG